MTAADRRHVGEGLHDRRPLDRVIDPAVRVAGDDVVERFRGQGQLVHSLAGTARLVPRGVAAPATGVHDDHHEVHSLPADARNVQIERLRDGAKLECCHAVRVRCSGRGPCRGADHPEPHAITLEDGVRLHPRRMEARLLLIRVGAQDRKARLPHSFL